MEKKNLEGVSETIKSEIPKAKFGEKIRKEEGSGRSRGRGYRA